MADQKTQEDVKLQQNIQKMRYSDDELQLLNSTFAERYDLLVLLRKFLLQGEVTEKEADNMKMFASTQLLPILKKTFLPQIDFTTPVGQLVDLWTNIDTKNKNVEGAWLEMAARDIVINYIKGRFDDLVNGTNNGLQFSALEYNAMKPKEQNFIELSARNTLISHIDFQTGQLWILAGNKKETLTEQQRRLFKDSSK